MFSKNLMRTFAKFSSNRNKNSLQTTATSRTKRNQSATKHKPRKTTSECTSRRSPTTYSLRKNHITYVTCACLFLAENFQSHMVECVSVAATMFATVVSIRKLVKLHNHNSNFSSVLFVKISATAKNV